MFQTFYFIHCWDCH